MIREAYNSATLLFKNFPVWKTSHSETRHTKLSEIMSDCKHLCFKTLLDASKHAKNVILLSDDTEI